jgi:hypothetical protein
MDSPNQILTKNIVSRLAQEKLLLPKDEAKALKLLAAGTLSGDDWKLIIENGARGGKAP